MKLEEYVIDVQMENIRETDAKDAYLCTKLSELGPTSVATDPKYYEVEVDGWLFWVNRETLEIISQGKAEPVYPEKIEVTNKNIEVYIGEGKVVDLKLTPNNASKRFIKYTSANEEIATVNNGVVTGIKEGTTEITIESTEDESIKDTCTVTVKAIELTGISLNKTETKVGVGKTETLTVTYTPSNATYKDIKWTSADRTIATVDENTGLITGVKAGETTITATSIEYPNIKAECKVSVELVLVIENEADLYKFAQDVNSGSRYEGYTVKLANDITINEGVTYTFDDDTGLIEVKQNENRFYIGTGYNGDTSGSNTTFDSTASTIGAYYTSNNSTETMAPIEGTMKLSDEVSCKTITCNGITLKIWEPIGNNSNKLYVSKINGQNSKIKGLLCNNSSDEYVGLMGICGSGEEVSNLSVDNSLFIGAGRIGGIIGQSYVSKISNVHVNDGYIVCKDRGNIGGVIGISVVKTEIYKVSNRSDIIVGDSYYGSNMGGIVGYISGGSIYESYNNGNIKGTHINSVGGICGKSENNDIDIGYCYNTGKVYGKDILGGILGNGYKVNINYCYNTGDLITTETNNSLCGGIKGGNTGISSITNCYNKGDVKGGSYVAGIITVPDKSVVSCYNEGKVLSWGNNKYFAAIASNTNYAPTSCHYKYYDEENVAKYGVSNGASSFNDNGCTKHTSEWNFNILQVMNSSTDINNQKFTTTTGRDENMPILKWEIGQ